MKTVVPFLMIWSMTWKQLSIDTTVFINHPFLDIPALQNEALESLKCNDYITCCFNGFWWPALIQVVNKEGKDLTWNNISHHWTGKEQKPVLLWENKCLDGGILFFVFDRLLTYIDFDLYFMMQLMKTSKFSWHLFSTDDKG